MKILFAVVLISLCCVSISGNVIYRKYQRTVPPRVKSHRKVTEIVEIFKTYRRPPPFGSSETAINLFLRNDAPPHPLYPPRTSPRYPVYPTATPPPSIFANRRSTTIRPNPYENNNGYMNHFPGGSVSTTKYAPVPNFTIREPPTTEEKATYGPEITTATTRTMMVEDVDVAEEVTPVMEEEERSWEEITEPEDLYEEVTEEAETEEPTTEPEVTEAPESETESEPEVTEGPEQETEPEQEVTEAEPEVIEEPTTEEPKNDYDDDSYDENNNYDDQEEETPLNVEAEALVQEEPEPTTKSSFWWG